MMKLSGDVALVTGAGRGQGAAHARELAALGASVVVFDAPDRIDSIKYPTATADQTDEVAADIVRAGGRAIAVHGDVRSQDDLDRAVKTAEAEFGTVDMLVSNAGIWGDIAMMWETSDTAWDETIAINLTGSWRSIKAVAPGMIETGRGSIVLVSSVMGFDEGMAGSAAYSVSKHGILGLTRSAAMEFGVHGVRVNAICPGFIDTDMHRWQRAYDLMAGKPEGEGTPDALTEAGRAYAALKGNTGLTSEEVAKTVAFLLSDAAGVLTGVIMPVDAGHSILPRVNQSPVR
jgi:NAD(P)-dependent dehydrogenase (short-subunit alcohol dehydrogenase family)